MKIANLNNRASAFSRRPKSARSGLTILEFLACVIAVIGGAWIGAIYLGVDLSQLAYSVLSEAQLLEKVPQDWRPQGPEGKLTHEELVAALRDELGVLRSEITALRAGGNVPIASDAAEELTASPESRSLAKERTRAYWQRLNEIALGEVALQQDAESAFNETTAGKVFAIKGRVSRFAAKSVEAIPSEHVDASVIQFSRQLADWYDRAGESYELATQIWESPTGRQGRSQLNEDWRRADVQHRNEAQLLQEKAAAVRSAINRRFGEEFPEFARPAGSTSSGGTAAKG